MALPLYFRGKNTFVLAFVYLYVFPKILIILSAWKLKVSVTICIADSQGIPCDHVGLASGASVNYKTTGDGTLHREVSNRRIVSGIVLDMRPLVVWVKMVW